MSQVSSCAHCGSDPVPHRITYFTVAIDEGLRPLFAPSSLTRFFTRLLHGLEKKLMDILAEGVTVPVKRLNAFRNIIPAPTLTVAAITLCGKTAHVFPAVLGAMLPPLQEKDCIRL